MEMVQSELEIFLIPEPVNLPFEGLDLVEITLWALCYLWLGCLPDAESALYFSGVSYTSIGCGDLVLPKPWRMLGPVEGLTGILMCGLSAALFFALVTRIYVSRLEAKRK